VGTVFSKLVSDTPREEEVEKGQRPYKNLKEIIERRTIARRTKELSVLCNKQKTEI